MGLTVAEANAVNQLLDRLYEPDAIRAVTGEPRMPSDEETRQAAGLLADHSYRRLMAGWDGDRIRVAQLRGRS